MSDMTHLDVVKDMISSYLESAMPSSPRRIQPKRSASRAGTFSRPPLQRMMLVHAKLKAGDFPNCRKMAVELEVSPKTIQRDVDFMRDRLGLPIEYDQLQFGFFYSEPVTSFPSIEVSEGEIVALYVAQKALEQYEGTPYAKPLKTAFAKISEGLRETVSFTWSDVDEIVSFRSAGRSTADIELFEELSRAVLRQVEVEFDYKKLGGKGHQRRRVHPYHLGCVENLWYLFSFDTARSQLRTFALTRMRNLRVSKSRFRRPPDFSVGKLLEQSFGVYAASAKAAERSGFASTVLQRNWCRNVNGTSRKGLRSYPTARSS